VSTTTVPCPYCLGDIAPQAQACKHCTRDLSLFKPILQHVHALEERLTQTQQEMAHLAAALEQIQDTLLNKALAHAASETDSSAPVADAAPAGSGQERLWLAPVVTVAALSIAHWVLLFILDTPLVFFRVMTFFIPVLMGLWAAKGISARFWVFGLMGAVIGVASVTSMLWVSHYIDSVPWAPQDLREWRETLEYGLSITLAFLTGYLVVNGFARCQAHKAKGSPVKTRVLLLFQRDASGKLKIKQISENLIQIATTLAPAVSGAVGLYSAVKSVLGS